MNTPKLSQHSPIKNICVMLAAVGTSLCANTVLATDVDDSVPQMVVHYADLNLLNKAGAAELYRRIDRAAERVCALPLDLRELSISVRAGDCKLQAIERAVQAVNARTLTSLHRAKTGLTEEPITVAKGF